MNSLRRPRPLLQPNRSPLFLVGAPGAGLAALYEIMGAARSLCLLDEAASAALAGFFGELHAPHETLGAEQATPAAVDRLAGLLRAHAPQRGVIRRLVISGPAYVRRIAFLAKAFPQAQFVYLHRGPEASLEAPSRWAATTRQALRDLHALPKARWCAVSYEALLADPADEAFWLGEFAGVARGSYTPGPLVRAHQARSRRPQPACAHRAAYKVNQEALQTVQNRHPSWANLTPIRAHAARSTPRALMGRRLAAGLCLGAAGVPSLAFAASYTVNNTQDSGTGSLRDAVDQANAAGGENTITFESTVTGTLAVSGGNILIDSNLDIQGPGSSKLTLDAGGNSRIFYARPPCAASATSCGNPNVTISGLTLQNGHASQNGGAIFATQVNLALSDVVVQDSNANFGGGIFVGGAGVETFSLSNSTVSHNGALTDSGGIYAASLGSVAISNTTIADNTSLGGVGGLKVYGGSGSINATTIANNTSSVTTFSSTMGGPEAPRVGGIGMFAGANLVVTGTTISGNTCADGVGGVYTNSSPLFINTTIANNSGAIAGGIELQATAISFDFSTISGNTASAGVGGIRGVSSHAGLANSILAGNMGTPNDANGFVSESTSFYSKSSIIGDTTTITFAANADDYISQAPQLGALANNGGPVQTMLPGPTSPAINAANPQVLLDGQSPPTTDARGAARPTTGTADMGAVQLQTCGSVVEGAACTCTSACITGCTCGASGTCSTGTVAADGTACTEGSSQGTCSSGTCVVTHASTTGGTTGGATTGGTTGGTTGSGTTTGGTTGSTTSSSGGSTKKSGCAASPLEGAAPLALSWMVGLVGRIVRRRRAE